MKMQFKGSVVDVHPSKIKEMEAKGYKPVAEVKPAPKKAEVKLHRRESEGK